MMNKTNYNEQIKAARKSKGLTQQELADETGLSLRTIQRIEKGTEEISGFSLRQISKILEIPLEQLIMPNVNQISIDTNQVSSVKALYLSSLCFVINPILGFLVPAIIGFSKQNKNAFYKRHLNRILLIQGTSLVLGGSLIFSFLFFKVLHYSIPTPLNYLFTGNLIFILPLLYYGGILCLTFFNFYKLKDNPINRIDK